MVLSIYLTILSRTFNLFYYMKFRAIYMDINTYFIQCVDFITPMLAIVLNKSFSEGIFKDESSRCDIKKKCKIHFVSNAILLIFEFIKLTFQNIIQWILNCMSTTGCTNPSIII